MQSFSMQGHKRVHHVNFLQPHQRGWKHFSLPEYSENSGKCISITLSTHVETVILLSRKTLDAVININLDMSELDLTSAESKATYAEIKKYVLDAQLLYKRRMQAIGKMPISKTQMKGCRFSHTCFYLSTVFVRLY